MHIPGTANRLCQRPRYEPNRWDELQKVHMFQVETLRKREMLDELREVDKDR